MAISRLQIRHFSALALVLSMAGFPASAGSAVSSQQSGAAARVDASLVQIEDVKALRAAGDPQLSPDGKRILFTVQSADRPGVPYTRIWIAEFGAGSARPWGGGEGTEGSNPRWSPDGKRVAFRGRTPDGKSAILVAQADGSAASKLAELMDTNHPIPPYGWVGERFAWSPDGLRIAFASAVPGPEPEMEAEPIVITRYQFRPEHGYPNRFVDNRRMHLFVADVATGQVRQITEGLKDEHAIDWSPDSKQLVYLSNVEPDPDFVFNYDLFTIDVDSKAVRRLTQTKSNEYAPRWSPDGKTIVYSGLKNDVTSSETNMEDNHVWTLDIASGERKEIGGVVDNRQGDPIWSPDGRWIYFTVQARGSAGLYRLPARGGAAERIGPALDVRGNVNAFDVAADGRVVAAMATPGGPAELVTLGKGKPTVLSVLNRNLLGQKKLAQVEAFTFRSHDGKEVEAFLTKPPMLNSAATKAHPMIVMVHGGPHGQQGPAFVHKSQVYAAQGWATLQVNYRGSTGYGQEFARGTWRDQNGGEAKDVLAAVDATLQRNPWIDPERLGVEGGSYGGQLSNWLVTQTPRFKAAIPWASISNLVTQNYLSVYHNYLQQEYGGKPHENGIIDMLWERSALRFVQNVKTPMLLSHGENDLEVNVAEIEQYFIALKDVGTEAVMLRYPREGHGMRESQHIVDFYGRSIDWYDRHFKAGGGMQTTAAR